MPNLELPIHLVLLTLDDDTLLGRILLFPGISCYGDNLEKVVDDLKEKARELAEETPLSELYRCVYGEDPWLTELEMFVEPIRGTSGWEESVPLRFHEVRRFTGETQIASFFPAMGIEVVAHDEDQLAQRSPADLLQALRRGGIANSLERLSRCQRVREVQLIRKSIEVDLLSPKQQANSHLNEKPVLPTLADNLSLRKRAPIYEREKDVARLALRFTGESPRGVLLVGDSGVGKTALVYQLVRGLVLNGLGAFTIWETSGSRLVAGETGAGMWQDRCAKLVRELTGAKAIVFLGPLLELMGVGQHENNPNGIADFLRTPIALGQVLAIAECTPEQYRLIEKESPHLLSAFERLDLQHPNRAQCLKIYQKQARSWGKLRQINLSEQAIDTMDRLHRRFVTYSAPPGRQLRFLDQLLRQSRDRSSLSSADVYGAFARETGLPLFLLDENVSLCLDSAHEFFTNRVLGQEQAVEEVVGLIASLKANLVRPGRPLASFLFIGPTGIGKTEMAKSLASYLFNDEKRLTRFDMSEYADPMAVDRLVGGLTPGGEGRLSGAVREQPFCVVLFDEFEKAHVSFYDLLLQILGDARLTDAAGRLADFSNAVVIMTSNLGAQSFAKGRPGVLPDDFEKRALTHFLKEVRAFLRPEIFNRIDRVIPFLPLARKIVVRIAKRELEKLRGRDGLREHAVTLEIGDDVIDYLARVGYEPKYGARPLKRAFERELTIPLSEALNKMETGWSLRAEIQTSPDGLMVKVSKTLDDNDQPIRASKLCLSLMNPAQSASVFRRKLLRLDSGSEVTDLRNKVFRLKRLEARIEKKRAQNKKQWHDPETLAELGRLPELVSLVNDLASVIETASVMEEEIELALFNQVEVEQKNWEAVFKEQVRQLDSLLLRLLASNLENPDRITLAFYSENRTTLTLLAGCYLELALALSYKVTCFVFLPAGKKDKTTVEAVAWLTLLEEHEMGERALERESLFQIGDMTQLNKGKTALDQLSEGCVGLAFGIQGKGARLRLAEEGGIHNFKGDNKNMAVRLDTLEVPVALYVPPEGVERKGAITGVNLRVYDPGRDTVRDILSKLSLKRGNRSWAQLIATFIEKRLLQKSHQLTGDPHPKEES